MENSGSQLPFVLGMPSRTQFERWPNWVDAPDTEDGANEDVIVPENQQSVISEETRWTAAEVKTPYGLVLPAMINLAKCEPYHVCVRYRNSQWDLQKDYVDMRWRSNTDGVSLRDGGWFPLECRSTLPLRHTGAPLAFVIRRAKWWQFAE